MEQAIADGHDVDKNLGGKPKKKCTGFTFKMQLPIWCSD